MRIMGSNLFWSWWFNSKESACNSGAIGDASSIPGWEGPLAEGMAIHSSILAWRTPWTEELGRIEAWSAGLDNQVIQARPK